MGLFRSSSHFWFVVGFFDQAVITGISRYYVSNATTKNLAHLRLMDSAILGPLRYGRRHASQAVGAHPSLIGHARLGRSRGGEDRNPRLDHEVVGTVTRLGGSRDD